MQYNLNVIETLATCDVILTSVNKDRTELESRRVRRLNSTLSGANDAESIPDQIAAAQAQLEALQATLPLITDGDELLLQQADIFSLQEEINRLTVRGNNLSERELANAQYSVGKLEAQVAAADEYIAALQARRAELVAAGGNNSST
jgi:hypothetical protein